MSLQEVIDREKWGAIIQNKTAHNESLDRIAEAAKKPRVMKRITEGCEPEKDGWYWAFKEGWLNPVPSYAEVILNGVDRVLWSDSEGGEYCDEEYEPDFWLELEPTPILPKDK